MLSRSQRRAGSVEGEHVRYRGEQEVEGKYRLLGDFYMESILGKIKMFMGCTCVCTCVQVCMWRAEVNLRCPSSSSVHLGLLRWVWNSSVQPSQLPAPGTLLSPPSQLLGLCVPVCVQLFNVDAGNRTQVFILTKPAIFPSSRRTYSLTPVQD